MNVSNIFAPQYLLPQGVLYDHQTEVSPPVGGVHLYDNLFILGYLLHIPHPLQVPGYGLAGYAVLNGKLFSSLLALDIVCDNLGFVSAFSPEELPSAILAFIQLRSASQAIPDHIFRAAEKAFILP